MLSDTVPEPFSIFALANRNRKRVSRGKGETGWRRKQKVEQKVELGVTLIKKKEYVNLGHRDQHHPCKER